MKKWCALQALLLILCLSQSAFAQQTLTQPAYKWVPKDIINVHDSIAVLWIRYEKSNEGIAVIDTTGKEIGQEVPLPDHVVGIALYGGNLLAFYQKDPKSGARELHAVQIDLATRQQGPDKAVYSVPSEFYTEFYLQKDPTGHFQGILARISGAKSKDQNSPPYSEGMRKVEATTTLSLTTLTGTELIPHMVDLSKSLGLLTFMGCNVNAKGDIFLVGYDDALMTVKKLDASGAMKGKLSGPFSSLPNAGLPYVPNAVVKLDPSSDNTVTVAVKYITARKSDDAEIAFRFDFTAGKTFGGKEVMLDKTYTRYLEAQQPGQKLSDIGYKEYLKPVDIQENDQYIVICKEMDQLSQNQYRSEKDITVFIYAAVISVYDKQMNLLRSVVLDKDLVTARESYPPGVGIRLSGDKLYALTSEMNKSTKIKGFHYLIDLKTGTFQKNRLPITTIFTSEFGRPAFTFWRKDGYLFNYVEDYNNFGRRVNTSYVPMRYE